jgi:hypothetical protein
MNKKYKNYIIIIILFLFAYMSLYLYKEKHIEMFEDYLRHGYVINLDSREDRLASIIEKFATYNLPLYKISAIKDEIGWKGCAYSFVSVIKMAKEKGLPSVLIMEDDCIPTKAFVSWPLIQDWLENNREQWDIFHGGNNYYGFNSGDTGSIQSICKLQTIRLYYTKFLAAQFIYVNSKAYDAMLEYETYIQSESGWSPYDFWPDKKNLDIISCHPFIAIQDKSYSDIEKREVDYISRFDTSEKTIGSIENEETC